MTAAPQGVVLETEAQLRALAPRIHAQVTARAMPPGNVTKMTDPERELLLAWSASVERK